MNDDLEVYISKDTKTLPIFDKFEKLENGENLYKRMIIKNSGRTTINKRIYTYDLIVERIDYRTSNAFGEITMTEFKKDKGVVLQYATKALSNYLKRHSIKEKYELHFNAPYYLRAQSSSNRTGYGWEWEWDNLIYEGTEYGECNNYGFVGIIVEYIGSSQESNEIQPSLYNSIPDPIRIETVSFHKDMYYKIYIDESTSYLLPYQKGVSYKEITREFKKIMHQKGKGQKKS